MRSKITYWSTEVIVDQILPPGKYVHENGKFFTVEPVLGPEDLLEQVTIQFSRREFIDLIRAERDREHKIQAIKYVRRATGWNLDEAKSFVDSLI